MAAKDVAEKRKKGVKWVRSNLARAEFYAKSPMQGTLSRRLASEYKGLRKVSREKQKLQLQLHFTLKVNP